MNIGFYGGSFDPFHKGHYELLRAALMTGRLDKVIVMPAGLPPHKQNGNRSFAAYRMRMAELACESLDEVELSSWEIERETTSYTVETLTYLKKLFGDEASLYLLVGQDMLTSLHKWYRFETILERATIMVADRPGLELEDYEASLAWLKEEHQARIIRFDMEPTDVSATEIRAAIPRGNDWQQKVSGNVASFIKENNLYVKDHVLDALAPETMKRLLAYERRIMKMMTLPRIVHVLNVMFEAVELATRFGADPDRTAVAALLHDVVKEKPLQEQRRMAASMDPQEEIADSIIHGPAATTYLADEFGIDDPEILRAVANHSILSADPQLIEMIVYLADKTEPARDYDDLPAIREASRRDLEEAVILTIEGQEMNLHGKGSELLPATLAGKAHLEDIIARGESHRA